MTEPDNLLLADFQPRSSLRVVSHEVLRPRFPVVDTHHHLDTIWGGDWSRLPVDEVLGVLDEADVETVINLTAGWGEAVSREVDRWGDHPDRVIVFSSLDYDSWSSTSDFGELEARRLRDAARRGARGLKVWKTLGLWARDSAGRLIAVDDERLDPLWATAAELNFPVVIHIADPIAFFDPLDPTNERWEELHGQPDWHFWPPRPAGNLDAPGFPTFDELLGQFDRLLGRHPATTFVGAHVASASEDLGLVSRLLDAHPNLSVDIAARLGELGRQPYTSRAFFLRYADRILFATDGSQNPAFNRIHYRFLETFDESFDYGLGPVPSQGRWQIHGIGLPDDVLRKVYRDNARKILGLAVPGDPV